MIDNTLSAGNVTSELHMPLFVPFLNAPAGGVVLYYDDFYLAEHRGRTHLLCGEVEVLEKELKDDADTVTRLTASAAFFFLEEANPVALLQNGPQILRYDARDNPDHIRAFIALKALVHRCKGLVDWKKLKYHAHPVTATFCADGLKRTEIILNTGAKALKLGL